MENIFKELGLERLTQEEKNQVLVQITDSLLKRLVIRVYDKLNETDQKEFERLADKNDVEGVNEFLAKKIPDFDEIRDEELEGLVEEMKGFFSLGKK